MRTKLVLALFLAFCHPAAAGDYRWPVLAVIDGDSIKVDMAGLPAELAPIEVRVRGVDTPETGSRAKCDSERQWGDDATAYTEALVLRSGTVIFRDPEWDKFGGRVLATVLINGQDLAKLLIGAGKGKSYDGGERAGWCDEVG
jgi:endonuclease YncB( thermonuclease family)